MASALSRVSRSELAAADLLAPSLIQTLTVSSHLRVSAPHTLSQETIVDGSDLLEQLTKLLELCDEAERTSILCTCETSGGVSSSGIVRPPKTHPHATS